MNGYSVDALNRKRDDIYNLAVRITFDYMITPQMRSGFVASQYAESTFYIKEYYAGSSSFGEAMSELDKQHTELRSREIDLLYERLNFFVIAEKNEDRNSFKTITLKRVGFVGGALQFFGGVGVCYAGKGAACARYGTPMMAHGAENFWENGYYLVYREDPKSMPLRNAYRDVAKLLGGDNRSGDISYSIGDLALSTASLFRPSLKADTGKLFHYIKDDFIIGWKEMGLSGLIAEGVGDGATGYSIQQLSQTNDIQNILNKEKNK
ncbi:DUF4225 domain-containing protein [Buttiauxella sp. WJP83]|uniref:DUF4225 domain-containing protein n=1 Tax=Buttiauxella sp. WJP83 TaxID=2986951 RepID=UPI0022DE4AF3|nr:DUF4225 domain-containing protein [Buttiauxella sp. WJP83]WBM69755.1 DUF4225 domain-containing protein [Buttiauxella sp. WJP83]